MFVVPNSRSTLDPAVREFMTIYVDDIITMFRTQEEYHNHL